MDPIGPHWLWSPFDLASRSRQLHFEFASNPLRFSVGSIDLTSISLRMGSNGVQTSEKWKNTGFSVKLVFDDSSLSVFDGFGYSMMPQNTERIRMDTFWTRLTLPKCVPVLSAALQRGAGSKKSRMPPDESHRMFYVTILFRTASIS